MKYRDLIRSGDHAVDRELAGESVSTAALPLRLRYRHRRDIGGWGAVDDCARDLTLAGCRSRGGVGAVVVCARGGVAIAIRATAKHISSCLIITIGLACIPFRVLVVPLLVSTAFCDWQFPARCPSFRHREHRVRELKTTCLGL